MSLSTTGSAANGAAVRTARAAPRMAVLCMLSSPRPPEFLSVASQNSSRQGERRGHDAGLHGAYRRDQTRGPRRDVAANVPCGERNHPLWLPWRDGKGGITPIKSGIWTPGRGFRPGVAALPGVALSSIRCRRDLGQVFVASRLSWRPGGQAAHGQCGRGWVPVGGRREGKNCRLAVRAGRHRRPLPGRAQRGPHPGHRRGHLQAVAAAFGRGAAGQAVRDRERRRGRSACPGGGDRPAQGPGSQRHAAKPADRRERHADPAAASGARRHS